MALPDFKEKIKTSLKPDKIKHFSKGSKVGNILLTRIRLDRSDLNLHKYTIGYSDTHVCMCHAKQESSLHFIIDCFLYSNDCQTLFNLVEQFIPNFNRLNKRHKLEAWCLVLTVIILIIIIQTQILSLLFKTIL